MKNDVHVPSKVNKQKNIVVGILKVTDEKSRSRIRILTKMSQIRNTTNTIKHEE